MRPGWATYRLTQAGQGAVTVTFRISGPEPKEGRSCWRYVTQTCPEGLCDVMYSETVVWLDENTLEPVYWEMNVYQGENRVVHQEGAGGPSGKQVYDPSRVPREATYLGRESVTVPAGTFTCDKFSVSKDGVTTTIWVSDEVPSIGIVRLATEVEGIESEMVLVDYGH